MIEESLALLLEEVRGLRREIAELRAEQQHAAGRWGSRADAAEHHGVSIDTIDRMIADGEIRTERLGPPPAERRDVRGRRIDRRRVRCWISGPPRTDAELSAMAAGARCG
jgi:hypothetical protein